MDSPACEARTDSMGSLGWEAQRDPVVSQTGEVQRNSMNSLAWET